MPAVSMATSTSLSARRRVSSPEPPARAAAGFPARPSSPQVKCNFLLRQKIVSAPHPSEAAEPRLHQSTITPTVNAFLELGAESRTLGPWSYKRHPFCQDEKTPKAPICWIIGLTCKFLYCQWHRGQRIAPANRGYRFAHNKNARRRFEGSGRARRRPLSPKQNRPIGANSQWDDSPQAARGYMNSNNRSRQMQTSARVGRRKTTASCYFAARHLLTEGFGFGGIPIGRTSESTVWPHEEIWVRQRAVERCHGERPCCMTILGS